VAIVFPEDDLSIEVTRFVFISQFYSFITDKSLTGDITQLDVNPDDPFARYQSPNGRLGAFNSGKWYLKAHDFLCTPNFNDWLCPIIYACDETLFGSHLGRASVTPLVFTLLIFNKYIRNKQTSWQPLGYVYDIAQHGKGMVTHERNLLRKMKPEEKCSCHHLIVQKLIESHVYVQRQGGIQDVPIELGTTRKASVNVKVPVGLILGDMQGGDKHYGFVVGYSKNMARIRDWDTLSSHYRSNQRMNPSLSYFINEDASIYYLVLICMRGLGCQSLNLIPRQSPANFHVGIHTGFTHKRR
jgi:hypothetical protein